MKVCVVGTGYVGLVSAACLAEMGHSVVCVDVDETRVASVNAGRSPIYEDGLEALLTTHLGRRLSATTSLPEALERADVALICVGTPFDVSAIDLSYVLAAAEQIGRVLATSDHYCAVAVKSTVVPGTTMGPVRRALESASGKCAGADFGLGMNPEFLAEGVAVHDFMHPDRIIVGGIDARSTEQLAGLYASHQGVPLIRTTPGTAEMIKYASNALLATLISYSNELADYCEATPDVDVTDVLHGVHEMKHLNVVDSDGLRMKPSITGFLWPGCGFGGSCFPKDLRALASQYQERAQPTDLLEAVLRVNQRRPLRLLKLLEDAHPKVEALRVTVLGLAFKPGTDDVRESPALPLVGELVARGARVVCHDPVAIPSARAALTAQGVDVERVRFEVDLERALADAAAVMLVTSWPEYRQVPTVLASATPQPLFVDGRRFLASDAVPDYTGIGMGRKVPSAPGS